MRSGGLGYRMMLWAAAVGIMLALPSLVLGQGGVAVDAAGVVRTKSQADIGGRLSKERIAAAKATLNPKVAAQSRLRKISLKHLEQKIIANQGVLTDEMRCLAGMLRLRYIFYYPDSKDIVLAGPAEGWAPDSVGRMVGITSGRPVLQLHDLVVALRAFPPGGEATKVIGCSIDPTQEGLAAMEQFRRSVGAVTPAQTQFVVDGLRDSLGMQKITVNGVPPTTRFAQVLIEADYRMKLIGIGLEKPPVQLVSYIDRANLAGANAMQRWFFVPDYQCVRTSEDGQAMELVGDGVKLVGESELVTAEGQRQATGRTDKASQAFVTSFTQRYSALADRSAVYAELRNLVDLIVGAAYIQKHDLYGKAEWKMEFLGNEKSLAVEVYNAPKQVAAAINAVWKGRRLGTPIGGGVQIEALMALEPEKILPDEKGKVAKLRQQTKIELPKGQWWWD